MHNIIYIYRVCINRIDTDPPVEEHFSTHRMQEFSKKNAAEARLTIFHQDI